MKKHCVLASIRKCFLAVMGTPPGRREGETAGVAPLLSAVATPIKVPVTNCRGLVYHLDIKIFAHTLSDCLKLTTLGKVPIAMTLLLPNPLFGLRQIAVFEPAIRIADEDAVYQLF